jgi:SET domain-containing protein
MPPRQAHDTSPPPNWPGSVQYLTKSRLSPSFPAQLIPLISSSSKFTPRPSAHPGHVVIKRIITSGHPANGQNGLFAKAKVPAGTLIIPYLGVIHASFVLADPEKPLDIPSLSLDAGQKHEHSDYDLSLLRVSASEPRNPFPGVHISIGVDADQSGNAGRMVNDYRGVGTAPNAEFRVGRGEGGDMRMELWSLKDGIKKGDEVLVSYGKGWWAGRRDGGD